MHPSYIVFMLFVCTATFQNYIIEHVRRAIVYKICEASVPFGKITFKYSLARIYIVWAN